MTEIETQYYITECKHTAINSVMSVVHFVIHSVTCMTEYYMSYDRMYERHDRIYDRDRDTEKQGAKDIWMEGGRERETK